MAEQLSVGLFQKGHSVTVYNTHRHQYKEKKFKGVDIVHCYDPELLMGTTGQFIYDLNCIRDAMKRNFDVWLFLGYTSSSLWGRLFPKKTIIISNMDGMEWKRSKYSKVIREFLKYAEKLAVKYSSFLVADSPVIQAYLKDTYNTGSSYIPYGADISSDQNEDLLSVYGLTANEYFMLMARMEKENNIEMILDGFHISPSAYKFIVVGNTVTAYGRYIRNKFRDDKRINFPGAIYDSNITHALRKFCSMYFHGHSVGGTNPSLLEAMADGALIAAHDNEFNRAVLSENGYYFKSVTDVQHLIETLIIDYGKKIMIENNLEKIETKYNWPIIISQYDEFITSSCNQSQ